MAILGRILLLIGTIVVIAGVGEVAARLIASADRDPRAGEDLPELSGILDLARPGVEGISQGVYYRTNSRGIRGPEYSPEPAPGTFRILIAGDSVTMGWGVAEEHSYSRVLEALLNEAGPEHPAGDPANGIERFEVINVGLAGVDATFSNKRIRRFSRIYQPHLTVYGFTLNDIEGPHYRPGEPGQASARSIEAWRRALRFHDSPSYLLRALWPRLMLWIDGDALRPQAEDLAPMDAVLYENYFENPEAWADFEAALDIHAEVSRRTGRCGHVFIHTHLTRLDDDHPHGPIYARVAEAARARGLSASGSFDAFVGRVPEDLWVHRFDVHPNREGHAILARALFDGLGELDADCFRLARSPSGAAEAEGGQSPAGGASSSR
jgi:lysophospholipase L1-like esterase